MTVSAAQFAQACKLIGHAVQARRICAKFAYSFTGYTDTLYIKYDTNDDVKKVEIQGLSLGVNCDAEGKVYMNIASSGGTKWSVKLFEASTRTATVCIASGLGSATSLASGDTITLTACNSSGITATAEMAPYAANNTSIVIIPRFNYPALLDNFSPLDADEELSDNYNDAVNSLRDTCKGIGAGLLSSMSSLKSELDNIFKGPIAELIDSGNKLSGNLLTATPTVSGGAVSYTYSGILKDFYDMQYSTALGFASNTKSFGSFTADSGNTGALNNTTSVKTPTNYVLDDDTITLECAKTLDSTCEEFTVKSKTLGEANYRLRLGQAFQAPEIGIKTLTVYRDILLTAFAAASGSTYIEESNTAGVFAISGETSSYVDSNGYLYGLMSKVAGGLTYIQYYKDSGYAAGDLVAQVSFASIADDNDHLKTVAAYGSSGITISQPVDQMQSCPAATQFKWTLNLKRNAVEDKYTFTSSNDEASLLTTLLGRAYIFEFFTDHVIATDTYDNYAKCFEDFLHNLNYN